VFLLFLFRRGIQQTLSKKEFLVGVVCDIELHVSQYSEEDRPMLQRKEQRYKNLLKALSEEQLVYNKSVHCGGHT